MKTTVIDDIISLEKEAEDIVSKAEKQAEELIEEANLNAKTLINSSLEKAQNESRRIIEEESKRIDDEVDSYRQNREDKLESDVSKWTEFIEKASDKASRLIIGE